MFYFEIDLVDPHVYLISICFNLINATESDFFKASSDYYSIFNFWLPTVKYSIKRFKKK